ncbi:MAG: dihydroorotase [Rhodospirillales bacterium]
MSTKRSETLGKVAYTNARLLDPKSGLDSIGALLSDGKTITDFGADLFKDGVPSGLTEVNCGGNCLAPGLVDIRVELREPGDEHQATIASTVRAATKGGVTSFVCLPNTEPVIDDMSVVEFIARRARKLGLAKVYCYGAVTKGLEGVELAEMGMLSEAGALAFTDGNNVIADAQVMRQALSYAATFNLLIVQQPELKSLSGGAMNRGKLATRLGLPGIPREAEIILIERDIRLVEMTGGRVHFAHISTSESIEVIRRAKDRGLNISCDTAPPYFSLNETAVGDYRTFSKLSPPLRNEDDRLAIVAGLKNGTIDAVASDHSPQDEESKRLPFQQAAFGGVGLETLLPVCLDLYHNGEMALLDVIGKLTLAPAHLLGLAAGCLEKGAPADVIIFDPDKGWKVEADDLLSKSKNSPFDGRPVQGRVLRTVIDGRTVYGGDE